MDIFRTVKETLGDVKIIAEDLGFLTDSVIRMVEESGYPGMKVLEFAFDSREPSNYLPHNYDKNCVVYTGTHDNETLAGWYRELKKEDKKFALRYMGRKKLSVNEAVWKSSVLRSRAWRIPVSFRFRIISVSVMKRGSIIRQPLAVIGSGDFIGMRSQKNL